MSEKYKNKYRTQSHRLQGYDYSSEGAYFITMNSAKGIFEFGNIENGVMTLNQTGKIVETELLKTPEMRKNIFMGEYCIMPNHIHFILFIGVAGFYPQMNNRRLQNSDYKNKFGAQINNLSSLIRGLKSSCTSKIIKSGNKSFAWQSNYYDVIIRNEKKYKIIENYIRNNPTTWKNDMFFKKHPTP